MRYGYFDDQNREYVITQPDTPLPWINYLGSSDYFGLISNTAGGYSFYKDARLRRITRFRYNNAPLDYGGRMVYLRDEEGHFWSPTWQPTRCELEDYSCRHGMGCSIISSKYREISSQVCYFTPLGESLEIWDATLTNQRSSPATLSVFSCVEFNLWDAEDDAANYQRNFNTGEVEVEDGVIYHKTEYRERRNHFAYFACSEPICGYDTQREAFLGPYRGWDKPLVVEEGKSTNSIAHGWQPVGSHHLQVTLQPGESKRIVFLLGYAENSPEEKFDPPHSQRINKQQVITVIDKYRQHSQVDRSFETLKAYWDGLLNTYQVAAPDEHVNRMVNIWNAYQCMTTFNLSRSASYFESGIGRGMGFRDSNQDILGFVHMIPQRARQRILDLAATQMEDGGAYHQYQPLTKKGNDRVGGGFNDDPLWLVLSTAAYLKETGDLSILDELAPYDNQEESQDSLYGHLQKCIQYTLDRLGPHGLPLIGRADWNDCLNLNTFSETPGESFQTTVSKDGKTAESVFIAGMFVLAAKELSAIARFLGQDADSETYHHLADRMSATILEHGWDGSWFLRAYDDNGSKVGSHLNEEGQIFIEPQGFCVLAGVGLDSGQAERAMDSVRERLATEHGIVLLQPAYTRYFLQLGEISSYPPGYKENGAIFCHTNPWVMIAEACLGRGDRALDYYLRINPSAREPISEVHRCEPYIYAQMIAGKDAATFGEAKNSWLTGTAAWNYVAITQWILGIRPAYQGLEINPVVPLSWDGFEVTRIFRGTAYHINVRREGVGNQAALFVNGERIEGNVIPLPQDGQQSLDVDVYLGGDA
jgi:cellobiose phosphorylase